MCRLAEEYSRRYLDAFFYEQVNDVGMRRRLRDSRGFCPWHAWQARKVASTALGVAIIAQDLITAEVARLDDLLRAPAAMSEFPTTGHSVSASALSAFTRGWRQKKICPACEVILAHERQALETLLRFLHDAEFARRLESAAPLCVIHTMRVTEGHGSDADLRPLLDMQRRKYAHLVGELEEFCRKHDYRFSHESWGAESDSWLRAIELLVGRPEVFGNEVPRTGLRTRGDHWWVRLFDRCRQWLPVRASPTSASDEAAEADGTPPDPRQVQNLDHGRE
jgi:hypothetical protein